MGAFDPYDKEQRYEMRRQLNEQRTADLLAGRTNGRSGGVPANLPDDAPDFMKDYRDYYKTPRGFHPRSVNSNGGWEKIATCLSSHSPCLTMRTKSVPPCLSYMEKRPIRFRLHRRLSPN